jgi:sorting nexin-9/18/33
MAASPPPMPALKLGNLSSRPTSAFDAGINASTAWTEHLERASTYDSDTSSGKDEEKQVKEKVLINGRIRPARALYPFEGQVEFKEL